MADLSSLRGYLSLSNLDNNFSHLASGLGFDAVEHPIDYMDDPLHPCCERLTGVLDGLRRVGHFDAQGTPVGLWLAESKTWPQRPLDRDRIRRRTAKTLVEVQPHGDARVLVILAHRDQDDFELVFPRVRTKGEVGTVRALISRSRPNNHHLKLLSELEAVSGLNLLGLSRRWAAAFDVERVTKTFYLKFKAVRDRFIRELADQNPDTLFADEGHKGEARRFATRNLGRVLFLWFLQSKGWLDQDSQYLLNQFELRCRMDLSHNFFRDSLVPLFFEALAVKPENRTERALSLGKLPYLNGGLFLQTHLEDELYGPEREHVDLEVPNDLFDPNSAEEASVLGLLRSYRFTTQESTPDNLSVDPDPELLGKVFENLNEETERKDTGTFYTPREIVRFMCRETLDGYLMGKTGVTKETLNRLRREAEDPESEDLRLTVDERKAIEDALHEMTMCDPAVGSGAFPVGMLHEVIELRRGLYQSADTLVPLHGQMVAEWKRETITHSLYGVDINPEAVEICQLRLWLSLVIDADYPEPLPNLDFRFVAGDSLIDRVGSDTLRHSLPALDHLGLLDAVRGQRLANIEADLFVLQETFSRAVDPVEARELREQIRSLQVEATRLQIEWLREQGESYATDLRRRYRDKERLGAKAKELGQLEKQIEAADKRLQVIDELLAGLDPKDPWAPYLKPMLWPVEFPEVFEAGGFDIVVANPPYVRQERLAPADQESYSSAFPEVHRGTADLLVYFYARALQILLDGGQLAFITSNGFVKRSFGKGLQDTLSRRLTLRTVIDFGETKVFDAVVEPYVLVAINRPPVTSHQLVAHDVYSEIAERVGRQTVDEVREQLQDLRSILDTRRTIVAQDTFHKFRWRIQEEPVLFLWGRLMNKGIPLGDFVKGRMYYGIKTGLNEAFVIDEQTRERLVAQEPQSAELIKPWLRGRDVKRWKAEWAGLSVIAIQNSGDANCQNPWRGETDERTARSIFANSYPAIHEHLSLHEGKLRPRADQGRFWWELRSCAYYEELSKPKAVWADISRSVRVAWDEDARFVDTTCFVATQTHKWLVALLNSRLMEFMFSLETNTPPGGFMRLKPAYIASLSIMTPEGSTGHRMEALADECYHNGETKELLTEIDEAVYELYGLASHEVALLGDWFERQAHSATSLSGAAVNEANEDGSRGSEQ